MNDKVARLRAIPLFSGLSEDSLSQIAEMMNDFDAPAGQVLIQPNLPGSGMFVIEEGTIHIKSPKFEAERGAGECVGELALLTNEGHGARVSASSDVKGFAVKRSDFQTMLESEPKLALSLLEVVATRLLQAIQ